MSAIEDIILDRDQRGISKLRGYLPEDYCEDAAQLILSNPGRAFVISGFFIIGAMASETDGPPGAYFIGKALQKLGYDVTHITDEYSSSLYNCISDVGEVIEFPVTDVDSSRSFARQLLSDMKPSIVISTERCGVTQKGEYLNMRGVDISQYNARADYLVLDHNATVGIGDGGNEIGMGKLAEQIPTIDTLPKQPTIVPTDKLILASVSNWGASGLIAGLSLQAKQNLLPSPEKEEEVIKQMVDIGAVDGFKVERTYAVDGFPLEENRKTLERLHEYLAQQGVS